MGNVLIVEMFFWNGCIVDWFVVDYGFRCGCVGGKEFGYVISVVLFVGVDL